MTNTTDTQVATKAHIDLDLSKLAKLARAANDGAADILEQAKAVATFTHTFTPPVASALVALAQQAAAHPAPATQAEPVGRRVTYVPLRGKKGVMQITAWMPFECDPPPHRSIIEDTLLYAAPVAAAAPAGEAKDAAAVTSVLRAYGDLEAAGMLVSTGILQIGNLMSNVMYELAQQVGKPLPRYECQQMDKLRKDWDAAMNTIAKLAQHQGPHGMQTRQCPGGGPHQRNKEN